MQRKQFPQDFQDTLFKKIPEDFSWQAIQYQNAGEDVSDPVYSRASYFPGLADTYWAGMLTTEEIIVMILFTWLWNFPGASTKFQEISS